MSFFSENMKALAGRNPALTRRIQNDFTPRTDLKLVLTPRDEPTAQLQGIYLHSSRAPRKEAAKLMTAVDGSADIVILQGLALGYHAEEFLVLHPKKQLWIVEPDIPLFLWVCGVRNLSPLLQNPRVTLLLAAPPQTVASLVASLPDQRFETVRLRSVYEKDKDYYAELDRGITGVMSRKEINRNTLRRFGRLWVRNLFQNLPLLQHARGIQRLENLLQGIPALVIAAGPSLEDIIPLLPELSRKAALIAVDTALFALTKRGIYPDFAVVVDPQFHNSRHLDGTFLANSFLVADSSTHPRVFRRPLRGIFFSGSPFPLGQMLERGTDITGRLGAGGSVATAAWETARHTGASAIYCAGLDLGFPGGQTHQKASYFERSALHQCRRLESLEHQNYRILREGIPFWADNNSGGRTLSDRRMEVYARWFEGQAVKAGTPPTYNLSPEGTALRGIPFIPASGLLELPDRRDELNRRLDSLDKVLPEPRTLFFDNLKSLRAEILNLEKLSRQGLSWLGEAENAAGSVDSGGHTLSRELDHKLSQLNHLDSEILSLSARNVAGFLFQDLIEELSRSGTPEEAPGAPDFSEKSRSAFSASRRLYQSIADSCAFHREILDASLRETREREIR